MKKWMAGLLSVIVVLSASAAVYAHGYGRNGRYLAGSGNCLYHPHTMCRFVDENGDGVCDRYGNSNYGAAAGYGMRGSCCGRGYCSR